ncbi:hypothetical protein F4556_005682 [Kitasatospora gansuensis]|uniref:PE domain-containing protein n=1 Tax=Kitasatospora gansuensis TaxID=258050 RepID=A0A7W7SGY2_9ACTN|nr:hypothetical protein [Kitasatospora gansuensis]MBB4950147.1 hypothetical protein [Kitasatospora gansuensis]
MSGEYQVRPEAIRRFAATAEQRADRLREIRGQLGAHQLSQGSFGRLPESDELYAEYQERAEVGVSNLGTAAESMARLAEHVEGVARNYEGVEEGLSGNLQGMTQGLGG